MWRLTSLDAKQVCLWPVKRKTFTYVYVQILLQKVDRAALSLYFLQELFATGNNL